MEARSRGEFVELLGVTSLALTKALQCFRNLVTRAWARLSNQLCVGKTA